MTPFLKYISKYLKTFKNDIKNFPNLHEAKIYFDFETSMLKNNISVSHQCPISFFSTNLASAKVGIFLSFRTDTDIECRLRDNTSPGEGSNLKKRKCYFNERNANLGIKVEKVSYAKICQSASLQILNYDKHVVLYIK